MGADWSALHAFLLRQGDEVNMSWEQMESIVGEIPRSALVHSAWWGGDRPHTRAWRTAGFELRDRKPGQWISFIRASTRHWADVAPVEVAEAAAVETEVLAQLAQAGSSHEQRAAEPVMLGLLARRIGVGLAPRRLTSPSGAYIDVDGVSSDGSVLVECWAHQGTAKVAQKYKLVNDAAKLQWAATWLEPPPKRLILCVSDELAVRHLRGRSWQGQAIRAMGVELEVVELPEELAWTLREAQVRQFR